MLSQRIIDGFTGRESSLTVKVKNTSYKLYIFFGTIRIPSALVNENLDLEEVGRKFDCVIKKKSGFYEIIPAAVKEIIERDGVLASYSEEHVATLESWLKNCFFTLLRNVLRGDWER